MKERWLQTGLILAEAAAIGLLARLHNLWPLALIMVAAIELAPRWRGQGRISAIKLRQLGPGLMSAASFVMLVAILPRALSQLVLTLAFVAWRWWLDRLQMEGRIELIVTLINQFLAFWWIFLAAAIWHWPRLLILALIWLVCYIPTRLLLEGRRDPAKAVVAAAWALVAAEVSWVCLSWLVSYVVAGGVMIVPQPAIILVGLGYCFGSIYLAQREGQLSRRRLSEYVVIAAAILIIVTVGTNWRGTI